MWGPAATAALEMWERYKRCLRGQCFVKYRLKQSGCWLTLALLTKANPSKDGDAKPPV